MSVLLALLFTFIISSNKLVYHAIAFHHALHYLFDNTSALTQLLHDNLQFTSYLLLQNQF